MRLCLFCMVLSNATLWPLPYGRRSSCSFSTLGHHFTAGKFSAPSCDASHNLLLFLVCFFFILRHLFRNRIHFNLYCHPGPPLSLWAVDSRRRHVQFPSINKTVWVKVCDNYVAEIRRFCELPTTENDVLSEKEI